MSDSRMWPKEALTTRRGKVEATTGRFTIGSSDNGHLAMKKHLSQFRQSQEHVGQVAEDQKRDCAPGDNNAGDPAPSDLTETDSSDKEESTPGDPCPRPSWMAPLWKQLQSGIGVCTLRPGCQEDEQLKKPGPKQALVGRPGSPELLFTPRAREHSSIHGSSSFSTQDSSQSPAPETPAEGRAQARRAAQARCGREDGGRVQNCGTPGVLQEILKENCRPDGRELGEFRTTTVNIGSISTADGSALVKLGNTTVVCGVKAEFAAPPLDAPDRGYVVPNVDLPPLCSSRFRTGPPGEEAQVASQFIADVIENSQIIKKEDLCISPGKLAWVLYCDLICLDYDGNILDACTFALLAALKNVQLPEVTINEETALAQVNLKKKSYLNVRTTPVATSFAVFDDTLLIVDPTGEEEHLSTGTLTIVMDEEGKLCCLHKPGGSGLTGAKLQDCMSRAVTRHKEVNKLLDEVIQSMKHK